MPREPVDPNHVFRECDARAIFGYKPTQLKEKIKSGDVPKPMRLAAPPSKARGWYGWQINEWAERVETSQEKWASEARNFYVPKAPASNKPKARPKKVAHRAKVRA
jgi:hypothetical protein